MGGTVKYILAICISQSLIIGNMCALAASTPPKDDAVTFSGINPIDGTVSIVFDYNSNEGISYSEFYAVREQVDFYSSYSSYNESSYTIKVSIVSAADDKPVYTEDINVTPYIQHWDIPEKYMNEGEKYYFKVEYLDDSVEADGFFSVKGMAMPDGISDKVKVSVKNGKLAIAIGGKGVDFIDAEPFIDENDRTQIPLRYVGEEIVCTVEWNEETEEVTLKNEYTTYVFKVGSPEIHYTFTSTDNKVLVDRIDMMDTSPMIVNDRVYVPLRFVAERFGYEVIWD